MYSMDYLNICINPFPTAKVYNPTRPEYYLKDPLAAAAKAEAEKTAAEKPVPQPKSPQQPPETSPPAVKVTLSDEAKAALQAKD
jgi:hypothetical protein